MARRPEGVRSWVNETKADQQVKTGEGILYSVNLSWRNLSVGDRIVLHDGTSAAGDKLFEFIVPTAAGSFPANLPEVGKKFVTGLFINFQVAAGAADDDVIVDIGLD